MDPEQLLRQAQAALQRGASLDEVNARLQETTGGEFTTLDDLQSTVGGPAIDPDTAAAAQSGSAVSDRAAQAEMRNIRRMDAQRITASAFDALRRGATISEVEERLQETTGLESIENLQQIAAGEDPAEQEALQRTAERGGSGVGDFVRAFTQGATLGFGDELAGLGAGVAAAVQGEDFGEARAEATEESRQRLEDMRRLNPGASMAGEVAGGLGTGLLGVAAASRATGPGITRGLFSAGSETTPVRSVFRAAGTGAGVGAAEGAAFSAGEADPDTDAGLLESLKERGAATASANTLLGAFGGGLLGAGLRLPSAGANAFRRTPRAGERLADEIIDVAQGGRRTPPSRVRAGAQQKKDAAREIFDELEASGEPITKEPVLRVAENNPRVQEALSPTARETVERLRAGETLPEGDMLTFTQVDDAAKNLQRTADAFERGNIEVRAEDVRRASRAFDELDTAMRESLEGFPEAKRLWGEAHGRMRSLSEGRQSWGKQADDIRSALEKAEDPEAFRMGLRNEVIAELEEFRGSFAKPPPAVEKFFRRGRGFEDQLRLLFDSDEQFQQFTRRVDLEKAAAGMAQKGLILSQAIAFLTGGTSLFGRLIG